MKKFNIIKKSRRNSEDLDEKIEYLNKECQKTGLNEITMSTSGIYQGSTQVPNQDFIDFESKSQDGYPLGLSGADGNSAGNANLINGVAYSPPHPVTGVRRAASHVRDGLGGTEPLRPGQITFRGFGNNPPPYTMGSALWFFDADFNNGVGQPAGRWCNLEWSNFPNSIGWGFWDTVKTGQFAGLYFFNTDLSQHPCGDVSGLIGLINFGTNGALGSLQTTVLTQNRLDDPTHIPIDIDGMSPQAFDYLKGKSQGTNVASAEKGNYDLYMWMLKTYPRYPDAAEWYLKTGKTQNNPFLPMGSYVPRASNPNQPPSPFAGAQDGDEFAFLPFGGGNNNKTFDPTKKQSRRDTINLINAVNSGDPLYLPPGVTMDQAREFVRNRDNGNLTEKFKLRNLKPNVNVDNDDTKKFNIIKKSRKKSKGIDEKIEYLEKECQKTGLNEIMSTTGIYQGTTSVPNQQFSDFEGIPHGGYGFALSGGDGNGAGGGSVGVIDNTVSNCSAYMGLTGVAISPPHPITGQRKCAQTQTGFAGFFSPLRPGVIQTNSGIPSGGALWFFDPLYNFAGQQGRWLNFQWHPTANSWAFWDTNFLGFFFLNPNLDQYTLHGQNVGTEIKNKLLGLNFGTNGAIGEPQTTVLTQNDLGNSTFLPINIPDLSGEAFEYLKNQTNKNVASGGVNYDLYNYLDKRYSPAAANWYENNPTLPHSSNPHIPAVEAPYVPLASNSNDSRYSDVVSDIDINTGLGAQDGDEIAFFGGDKPVDPTKKQNKATTQNIINYINSGGFMPLPKGWTKQQAQQFYDNYYNGNLSESLNEDVGIGHFEPEVLNVDINDIRKGIMPEFPKDPPPEMIGGYSAKSRLVRKDPQLPPFIKVTRKDLAKNHLLTDKQISEFLNDIKMINEYIKKNPAELMYAMIRYPKDDPRLAQLNFKMDEMKRASDRYVETHFPENISLFNKLQNKIRQNIEMTNPDNFTGHAEAPKFIETDISEQQKRRKTIIRHFKKKK